MRSDLVLEWFSHTVFASTLRIVPYYLEMAAPSRRDELVVNGYLLTTAKIFHRFWESSEKPPSLQAS
jgi:hypothetical protein